MPDKIVEDLEKLIKTSKQLPEEAKRDLERKLPKYEKLIKKMAHKYVRARVEYDDLVQEALMGFMLACRDFNPERSNDFHTYAIYRMKGKMYEYCIRAESPIYVPTHVGKAAAYVKQMQRLLDKEPSFADRPGIATEIIKINEHEAEADMAPESFAALRELKRKLGNIANTSKMAYERLAGMAMESLSLIVSDEVLNKHPEETGLIDDIVSNRELSAQIKESLGEKKFTVVYMKALGWSLREIAERLFEMGYTNKNNEQITRQAVKAILDDTNEAIKKMKLSKNIK